MKRCLGSFLLIAFLALTACRQQSNNIVSYPFQEGRALVGIANAEGKMAYMIINAQQEVVSYIHITDVKLDTVFRDGKLAFQDLQTGQQGYIDLSGKVVREEPVEASPEVSIPKELEKVQTAPSTLASNDWRNVIEQSPFYEEAKKTFSGNLDVEDAANREMILDYVEQLRKSYTTKDLNFIEQVFSEKALIITGKVIRTATEEGSRYLPQEQVTYNIRSKAQYIERLRQIFQANRHIDLLFSDFKISRHPTIPTIYGVSLRQTYSSDIYSDDGYLFLLWDFAEAEAPKIHVRTWQPRMLDNHTVIPENEIFSLRNFTLK